MYYYGVFKIDARLYNNDNVFLNQVNATCSFRETNNYISCDLREEPWDWLVQNLPRAVAQNGTSYAEIIPGLQSLVSNSGAKFVPLYQAQMTCYSCQISYPATLQLEPVTCLVQSDTQLYQGHLARSVQANLETQAMFPLNSYQCHRCLGQCALSAGHVDMPDFFMVHIPLMNYKNMHNPSILVQENECLFGQEYKLTAAIQMLPQHFLSIVYHQGSYAVLDDLQSNVGFKSTFPGAIYRNANLNQHYKYLNQDHAGVHVFLYAKMNNGIPSCGSSQRPPSYPDVLQSYKNTTPPLAQTPHHSQKQTLHPLQNQVMRHSCKWVVHHLDVHALHLSHKQTPHHSQKQTFHPLQNQVMHHSCKWVVHHLDVQALHLSHKQTPHHSQKQTLHPLQNQVMHHSCKWVVHHLDVQALHLSHHTTHRNKHSTHCRTKWCTTHANEWCITWMCKPCTSHTNTTPLTETNTPSIAEPSDAPLMQMSGASLGCASPAPLTQTDTTPLTETNTLPISEPSDASLMQMSGASLGCASPAPLTQTDTTPLTEETPPNKSIPNQNDMLGDIDVFGSSLPVKIAGKKMYFERRYAFCWTFKKNS